MTPFPFMAAIFLVLSGLFPLFAGGWLLLSGVWSASPFTSMVLLGFTACLLSFQGALHWGMVLHKPDIIVPQNTFEIEKYHLSLGCFTFFWAWFSLMMGMFRNVQAGYLCEIAGFLLLLVIERKMRRFGRVPRSYYPVKIISTCLTVLGLFAALCAPQGRF